MFFEISDNVIDTIFTYTELINYYQDYRTNI